MPAMGMDQGAAQPPEAGEPEQTVPPVEGRRTQLRIVRENIDSLSNDVGAFRRKHEVSVKRLEKQVAKLRSELRAQTVSKDVEKFRKSHDLSTKKLEMQIASLRNELAEMKHDMAKDAAKGRAKQEAALSKFLARVNKKPKAPAKSKKSARSKKR